jgi:hypothetical protein
MCNVYLRNSLVFGFWGRVFHKKCSSFSPYTPYPSFWSFIFLPDFQLEKVHITTEPLLTAPAKAEGKEP